MNSVYTYGTSFDFDKFVADFSLTDFTVSDTTVINSYAPSNTADVSRDFINQAESLNGPADIGSVYLWTSKQLLFESDLARLQELAASSNAVANELGNYMVRKEYGVKVYGLDYLFPTSGLLGNMVAADQPARKTVFNVDDENLLTAENWLKNYTANEGVGYSALGFLCSLILSIAGSLTAVRTMGAELSYFTWHFTLLSVILCIIPLVRITALVCYSKMARKTVVERLHMVE